MHDLIWVIFKSKNNKILILKRSLLKTMYTLPEINVKQKIDNLNLYIQENMEQNIGLIPNDLNCISEDSPYGRRIATFLCHHWDGELVYKQKDIICHQWISLYQIYNIQEELSGYFRKLLNRISFCARHESWK